MNKKRNFSKGKKSRAEYQIAKGSMMYNNHQNFQNSEQQTFQDPNQQGYMWNNTSNAEAVSMLAEQLYDLSNSFPMQFNEPPPQVPKIVWNNQQPNFQRNIHKDYSGLDYFDGRQRHNDYYNQNININQNDFGNSAHNYPPPLLTNNASTSWPAALPNKFGRKNGNWRRAPGEPREAAQLTRGRGMHLLKQMGWRPGEGLGKDNNGTLQPLQVTAKFDKRGLVTKEEQKLMPKATPKKVKPLIVEGKHPISILCEYAMQHRIHLPQYIVKSEGGTPHLKTFIFTIKLNDIEYDMPDNKEHHLKKKAKEIITRYALQKLGINISEE